MLRIGAVSYLNTKPLIHELAVAGECAVELDLPSTLATRLSLGEYDAALVPVAALFQHPEWTLVSDACIACAGPVWSVKLCGRVPLAEARTIALDVGSLTSVILAKTLVAQERTARGFPGLESIRFSPLELEADWQAIDCDAVLIIGDRAMRSAPAQFVEVWDSGARWRQVTGLPFVFAAWAARPGADFGDLARRLTAARERGVGAIEQIAGQSADRYGLTRAQCRIYLEQHLHFYLGSQELLGLETFYARPATCSWSPRVGSCSGMIAKLLDKAVDGARLTPDEGLQLLQSNDVAALAAAADAVCRRLHPEPIRTYNIDRNINYTNICTAVCDFCAFYRSPKSDEGYVLPRRRVAGQRSTKRLNSAATKSCCKADCTRSFKLEWYEEMLADIKQHYPAVNIHGFSPPEIHHFTNVNKLPLREVLQRLQAAGLGSLPGGGAEILVDRVRTAITRGKVLTDDWLNVMRVWHELGGLSTATMMFGHVETLASGSSTWNACGNCRTKPAASPPSFAGHFSRTTRLAHICRRSVRSSISRRRRSRVCIWTISPTSKPVGSPKA